MSLLSDRDKKSAETNKARMIWQAGRRNLRRARRIARAGGRDTTADELAASASSGVDISSGIFNPVDAHSEFKRQEGMIQEIQERKRRILEGQEALLRKELGIDDGRGKGLILEGQETIDNGRNDSPASNDNAADSDFFNSDAVGPGRLDRANGGHDSRTSIRKPTLGSQNPVDDINEPNEDGTPKEKKPSSKRYFDINRHRRNRSDILNAVEASREKTSKWGYTPELTDKEAINAASISGDIVDATIVPFVDDHKTRFMKSVENKYGVIDSNLLKEKEKRLKFESKMDKNAIIAVKAITNPDLRKSLLEAYGLTDEEFRAYSK